MRRTSSGVDHLSTPGTHSKRWETAYVQFRKGGFATGRSPQYLEGVEKETHSPLAADLHYRSLERDIPRDVLDHVFFRERQSSSWICLNTLWNNSDCPVGLVVRLKEDLPDKMGACKCRVVDHVGCLHSTVDL